MCARLAQRIHDDLPCCRCGYNLRTLSRFGRCPECAAPVSASLQSRQTPAFRTGRGLYVALVVLCYAAPLIVSRFVAPGLAQGIMWASGLALAVLLAVAGFIWSSVSAAARYSIAVFLATLASYVYVAWLALWIR